MPKTWLGWSALICTLGAIAAHMITQSLITNRSIVPGTTVEIVSGWLVLSMYLASLGGVAGAFFIKTDRSATVSILLTGYCCLLLLYLYVGLIVGFP